MNRQHADSSAATMRVPQEYGYDDPSPPVDVADDERVAGYASTELAGVVYCLDHRATSNYFPTRPVGPHAIGFRTTCDTCHRLVVAEVYQQRVDPDFGRREILDGPDDVVFYGEMMNVEGERDAWAILRGTYAGLGLVDLSCEALRIALGLLPGATTDDLQQRMRLVIADYVARHSEPGGNK